MLRINLLPIRQLKKRAKARNQIVSFITLVVFLLLILGAVGFLQHLKIQSIESAIAKLVIEENKLKPVLAKMERLKKAKLDLENKIRIIKQLKEESSLTVHILDEVAKIVDSKRLWLKSLKHQGMSLSLSGVALDNKTVAHFMDTLKTSAYIGGVNLSNSSLIKVSGRDLKSFSLACSITIPKKNIPDETK